MKWLFLLLAKLIVMGFWLGSVYFIFIHPIEGKIHTLIPVFAVLVLTVHAIQAASPRQLRISSYQIHSR